MVWFLALFFTVLNFGTAYAQTQPDWQLELEQLKAQVDVMLEEVNTLQRYRICAEKGYVYRPSATNQVDEDGCTLPESARLEPTAPAGVQNAQNNPIAPATTHPTPAAAINKKPLAQTAKTFRLPPPGVVTGGSVPLKSVVTGNAEASVQAVAPVQNTPKAAPLPPEAVNQTPPPEAFPILEPDYPNEDVKHLIEAAVERALSGKSTLPEETQPLLDAPAASAAVQKEGAKEAHSANTPANTPANSPIIPSCRPGEFLTTFEGQVVCQPAANVGKLACPPSTLRVWVDWYGKHIHFQVGYTPHGQEQGASEKSHEITVMCDNGKYKLQTVTRNECGGHFCHPNQKPAYSLTYVCNQDATGRCYAKQDGQLLNHVFTEARISQQY